MKPTSINKRKIFNDPVYGFIAVPYDIILDLIDHVARSSVSSGDEGWKEYANFIYANSPVFREFFLKNKSWYRNLKIVNNQLDWADSNQR